VGNQLLLSLLLLAIPVQAVVAQNDAPIPPAAGDTVPVQPMLDEARGFFDRLMAASDGGDRKALASFRPYYKILYSQAYLEAAMEEPAAATMMARELDRWLTEKAQGGSPTAQFWMAERAGIVDSPGGGLPDLAEADRWYRAAAEQGFAPAQDALGQFLTFLDEFRREPYESEKWYLQAARQGEVAVVKRLLLAIDLDSDRPDYKPRVEILAWLQEQSEAGDEKAKKLLVKLASEN
jgi:TPR repeat protein